MNISTINISTMNFSTLNISTAGLVRYCNILAKKNDIQYGDIEIIAQAADERDAFKIRAVIQRGQVFEVVKTKTIASGTMQIKINSVIRAPKTK